MFEAELVPIRCFGEQAESVVEIESGKAHFLSVALAETNTPSFPRSEEHTSELQSRVDLVCRLLLEKKNKRHSRKTGPGDRCATESHDQRPGIEPQARSPGQHGATHTARSLRVQATRICKAPVVHR